MGGINQINRRRPNFHQIGRKKTAKARASRNVNRSHARLLNPSSIFAITSAVDGTGASLSGRKNDGIISTRHQRQMLLSDPKANIELSKKKLKKVMHALKMEQQRLIAAGVVDLEMKESTNVPDIPRADEMELSGCGGTLLGAPNQ